MSRALDTTLGTTLGTTTALLTPGEPAGIGPEMVCQWAAEAPSNAPLDAVVVADPQLLTDRARDLGIDVDVIEVDTPNAPRTPQKGQIHCWPVPMAVPSHPGQLAVDNAGYVLACLERAAQACLAGEAQALITGPIHKGIINDAGIAFTGHTEFLQHAAGVPSVVMMLACERAPGRHLRVALVTTHVPLHQVASLITPTRVERTLEIVDHDLRKRFGIAHPRISVLGLNPHAGEGGHLGEEERDTIEPVLAALQARGMDVSGPWPADTAFVPSALDQCDCVVAMYHDQGLPVLKHAGFGHAVNITLGLPFIRTSVDHGTALDIAGQGRADLGSLKAAVAQAKRLISHAP